MKHNYLNDRVGAKSVLIRYRGYNKYWIIFDVNILTLGNLISAMSSQVR